MNSLRQDVDQIVRSSIAAVLPDAAVRRALAGRDFSGGELILIAAGKAAWQMASAAREALGERVSRGVVVTKYGHVKAPLPGLTCVEAGHPTPDENSCRGAELALEAVRGLAPEDTVLFLLSGGGSALFEAPLIPLAELADVTDQLLACGADITEMNTVRKRLSAVKGGKFALACAPAKVYAVVLSDVLGDPLDMIASGPAAPDRSTAAEARTVAEKYHLRLSPQARALLDTELPKDLPNVETVVTGSVRELCAAGEKACEALGYQTLYLTDQLSCEAREAGRFLSAVAKSHAGGGPLAVIAGGETVVHLTGHGKGGRNQELALAAAEGLDGMENAAVFSFGSDGTDGPTDAAGGYADGGTCAALREKGLDYHALLADNDAYCALEAVGGLIVTGPTGTNVNDLAVLLIR